MDYMSNESNYKQYQLVFSYLLFFICNFLVLFVRQDSFQFYSMK